MRTKIKHRNLIPGDMIGERKLLKRVRHRNTTYWRCLCSCGKISLCAESNLIRELCLACCGHFTRKLKRLGISLKSGIYSARTRLFKRYGMCYEWLDDISKFAECYMQKRRGYSMIPKDSAEPLGPTNYRFVKPSKLEGPGCAKARKKAEEFIGERAWTASKQYIYQVLSNHGVKP